MSKKIDIFVDNRVRFKKLEESKKIFYQKFLEYLEQRKLKNYTVNVFLSLMLDELEKDEVKNLKVGKLYHKINANKELINKRSEKFYQQDLEAFKVSGFWEVISYVLVLMSFGNIMAKNYLINIYVDNIVFAIFLAITIRCFIIHRQFYLRYHLDKKYMYFELFTLIGCGIIKIMSQSIFDISFIILVAMYYFIQRSVSKSLKGKRG